MENKILKKYASFICFEKKLFIHLKGEWQRERDGGLSYADLFIKWPQQLGQAKSRSLENPGGWKCTQVSHG